MLRQVNCPISIQSYNHSQSTVESIECHVHWSFVHIDMHIQYLDPYWFRNLNSWYDLLSRLHPDWVRDFDHSPNWSHVDDFQMLDTQMADHSMHIAVPSCQSISCWPGGECSRLVCNFVSNNLIVVSENLLIRVNHTWNIECTCNRCERQHNHSCRPQRVFPDIRSHDLLRTTQSIQKANETGNKCHNDRSEISRSYSKPTTAT